MSRGGLMVAMLAVTTVTGWLAARRDRRNERRAPTLAPFEAPEPQWCGLLMRYDGQWRERQYIIGPPPISPFPVDDASLLAAAVPELYGDES